VEVVEVECVGVGGFEGMDEGGVETECSCGGDEGDRDSGWGDR